MKVPTISLKSLKLFSPLWMQVKQNFLSYSPNNGGLTLRIQVNIRKYDTQVYNLTWGIMEIIVVPGITKARTGF